MTVAEIVVPLQQERQLCNYCSRDSDASTVGEAGVTVAEIVVPLQQERQLCNYCSRDSGASTVGEVVVQLL